MAIETPDALKGLKGIGGYNDLSKGEKNELLNRYLADGTITKDTKMNVVDRIYRNDLFVQKFGIDEFKKYDAMNRDRMYERQLISDAMVDKFGENDPNLGFFQQLSLDAAKEVLQDNTYVSADRLAQMEAEARKAVGENKKFTKKGELISGSGGTAKVPTSMGFLQLTRAAGQFISNAKDRKLGNISDEEAGKESGRIVSQILTGKRVLTNQDVDESIDAILSKNAQYVENVYNKENLRIINSPEVTNLKEHIKSTNIPQDQNTIDEQMDNVFINDIKGDKFGSAWYTGFRDSKEMKDFTYDDKRDALAKFEALKALGGESYAMVAMNSYFQDWLENKQRNMGTLINRKWANIGTAIMSKAAGYVGQQLASANMITHLVGDTPEEFNEFMTNSIDEEGKGRNIFNPIYWNYVDQLSTWSPSKITAIINNGGVSSRNEVPTIDGEMTAGQYAREGMKMVGYMLPAAAISLISRNVKLPSSVSTATKGKLAKGWSWVETMGGALSLANSYAIGTYEQIMTEGMQRINESVAQLKARGYSDEYIASFKDQAKSRLDKDAKRGMAADWGIEAFRMAILQRTLLSWTKSQPTRDVINGRYTEVARTSKTSLDPKLSKSASMWKKGASAVFGGFESNYFDDVTVGFGKGVGEGRFNDWMSLTNNGENLALGAQLSNDFIVSLSHGLDGAEKALYDKQSWRDGLIGALGTGIGGRVNVVNMVHDIFAPKGSVKEAMNTIWLPDGTKKEMDGRGFGSAVRWLNRYVSTGLTTAMADEAYNYDRTVAMLDWSRNIFQTNTDALSALGSMVKFDQMMDNATSTSQLKTLKTARDLVNYIQLSEWMKDPIMSQLGELMGFNDLMNDAAKGNISSDMLNQYINDSEVNGWLNHSSISNKEDAARKYLQKRAQQFVKIRDTYTEELDRLSDPKFKLNTEQAKQIAYQVAMNQSLIDRQHQMAKELGVQYKEDMPSNPIARFGNLENYRAHKALLQKDYDMAKRTIEEGNKKLAELKKKAATVANAVDAMVYLTTQEKLNASIARSKVLMDIASSELSKASSIERYFDKRTSSEEGSENSTLDVITAEDILSLRPDDRAFILDEANRSIYSAEQQAEIKKAEDMLVNRYSGDFMEVVKDSGKLQQMIDETNKLITAERKDPAVMKFVSDVNEHYYADRFADIAKQKDFADKAELLDQVTDVNQGLELLNKAKYLKFSARNFEDYIKYVPEKTDLINNLKDKYLAIQDMLDTLAAVPEINSEAHAFALDRARQTIITAFETEETIEDAVETIRQVSETKSSDAEDKVFKDALAAVVREFNIKNSISEVAEEKTQESVKADEEVVTQTNEQHKKQEEAARQAASAEAKPEEKNTPVNVDKEEFLKSLEGDSWVSDSTIEASKMIKWGSPRKPDNTIEDYVSGATIKGKFAPAFKLLHDAGILTVGTAEDWNNAVTEGKIPHTLLKDTVSELKSKDIDSTRKIVNALKGVAKENTETEEIVLDVCPVCGAKLGSNEESCHQCGTDLKVYHKLNEYKKKAKDGTLNDAEKADLKKSAELLGIPYAEDQFTVDAEGRGHLELAPVADQHTQTTAPTDGYAENQSTFSEDTAENLVGHIVPDYNYKKLSESGIYEERTGSSPTDPMSRMHQWFKTHGIAIQDIIDNQLGRILKANPSQKINIMKVKDADGQLPFNLLALEYDGVVKRIHKAEEDLVMAQDGKQYLIVGSLGYNSVLNEETGKREARSQGQFDAFNLINDRLSEKATSFFKANRGSSVYVSRDMFTEVADIYAGFITNNLRGEEKELRSISTLLKDSSRNPFGYKMQDLKWFIQTESTFLGIGVSKDKLYAPIDSEENMGGVFVAIPVPNGNFIPLKIQRTNLSEIKEGTLKNRILGILDKLTAADYDTRKSALKDFLTYIATREGYDVLIGNAEHNTITLEENGNKVLTLDMSDPAADVVSFKNAVMSSPGFYANLTAGILSDSVELANYDEAGCLNTTAAKLGTVGVSYTVRPVDATGKPIVSTETETKVPGEVGSTLRNTYDATTIGKDTYYFTQDGVWRDEMMNPIDLSSDPKLETNLFYNQKIKKLTPTSIKDGIREYIISSHRTNPIIIQVDKNDNVEVFNSTTADIDQLNAYIEEVTNKLYEKEREEKILRDGGEIIDGVLFTKEDLDTKPIASLDDLMGTAQMGETLGIPDEAPVNSEETETKQPAVSTKPEIKPASDNSNLLRQNNSESINFDTLKLNRVAMSDLRTILNMPQASIKEIKATLVSLGVSLDGITNTPEGIRDWLDYIKNCKIV